MPETLLATKLYIPAFSNNTVPRPRLIEQMQVGAESKLTLISGPPGFGKTSLALAVISGSDWPVAWLSLDEGDNDLILFFAYLIAALQKIDSSIGQSIQIALNSPSPPPVPALVAGLINDIAISSTSFVLILDDYHTIKDISIHEALRAIIDRQPPQMHLVIITRVDPPFPLARLRAQRQMTEIRANQLRFTIKEAESFLNDVMHLGLSLEEVAVLTVRTEGWIAGLQLAALSLRNQEDPSEFVKTFTGNDRHIMDYLVDEALSRQAAEVEDFLLQSSLMDRLSGRLCDTLLGLDEGCSQTILEYLEQANLFVLPLDNQRVWYRYHHLFAELLRARLSKAKPKRLEELHRRAAGWFEEEGLIPEAIHHALGAQEIHRAAGLIEQHTPALLETGDLHTLLGWMKSLPEEVIQSRPWLGVNQVWAEIMAGRVERGRTLLHQIDAKLGQPPCPKAGDDLNLLDGNLSALHATLDATVGEGIKAKLSAQKALELLPENARWTRILSFMALGYASRLSGDLEGAIHAFTQVVHIGQEMDSLLAIASGLFDLGTAYRLQGKLNKVIVIYEELQQLSDQRKMSHAGFSGRVVSGLASVLYELNQVNEAREYVERSLRLSESWPNPNHDVYSFILLIKILIAQGDLEKASEVFEKIRAIVKISQLTPVLISLVDYHQVRLWLIQGKLGEAVQWAGSRKTHIELSFGQMDELKSVEILSTARVWMAQAYAAPASYSRKLEETLVGLDWLIEASRKAGYGSHLIEALLMRSLAARLQGKQAQAMELLGQALDKAEPEGFIRTFVDFGQPLAELIYEAASQGISTAYCGRLLAVFSDAAVEPARAQKQSEELIEPLSEREIEVLRLIANGLSNSDIAQRLYLSLNTVKGHTRNIYAKLNVNSRTQAAARARSLGILPPG